MLSKGPHISINAATLVPRILRVSEQEFSGWPQGVRRLAMDIAEELFLVRYNPFVSAEIVRRSVHERFESSRKALAQHYATSLAEGLTMFWSAHEGDMAFRGELIARLGAVLAPEDIDASPHSLVENATDATDLRLELPLLVVTPRTAEEVSAIVRLANEMQFALVPRGGGSGLTGGAIPALKRSVIMALTKLTAIGPLDEDKLTLALQAGVITNDAIAAAAERGLLFSVDPASKTASTIGGNIAENAGGPLCFEYGTTIDNLLSYRMVTPTGEIIQILRQDHPRHKIHPEETAVFEVRDLSGGLRTLIRLPGSSLRGPGLGKDVTNKTLEGLPGVQKEGTDGVILDATFILHRKPAQHRVMVLEFFGRSMENCMLVVNDLVALRNDIRRRGDLVRITAMEEFGAKYIQAIEYQKRSLSYEGDPISVLILQLDSDAKDALDEAVRHVVQICGTYDGVDAFVARDDQEGEIFWEDRHRLSAIARRTSGFKINEDVVIPLQAIPDFALYLESLNLEYAARAYRAALRQVSDLPGFPDGEERITEELAYIAGIVQGEIPAADLSDQELHLRASLFLRLLAETYPALAEKIAGIESRMQETCICIASHMHAGDGNWHVNIPVNSNDPEMLQNAGKVAALAMSRAQALGGEVTGEHGVGITKIAFLSDAKMADFQTFKQLVDPRNIFNPAKLTQRALPVASFTFSFNRLIQDLTQSGLQDKERLIALLTNVQICTRCGKCKQFCPMHDPGRSMLYHPRNRNLSLGALVEALYYFQVNHGKSDPALLAQLRDLVEHCTACGKCLAVCPVKIPSAEVALTLRGYLVEEGADGHPLRLRVLRHIAAKPAVRIPRMARLAALGQSIQNRALTAVPASWRARFSNPLFTAPGPRPAYRSLAEVLRLDKGSFFLPQGGPDVPRATVLYFPGCGSSIFLRNIGLAGLSLLLRAGYAVLLPEEAICCGYPLLAAGAQKEFDLNQERNIAHLRRIVRKAQDLGFPVSRVLTSCGSCLDGLERHLLPHCFPAPDGLPVELDDTAHFLFSRLSPPPSGSGRIPLLYHTPCHGEIPGLSRVKVHDRYVAELSRHTAAEISVSPGCCAESGLGAISSPAIYNKIRARKALRLKADLAALPDTAPVLVSCPSCKLGLQRILMPGREDARVLHTLEYLAALTFGPRWTRLGKRILGGAPGENGLRRIPLDKLHPPEEKPPAKNGQ
ncbi:MAG: FAD-binding oxidoreductase [Deltaproteobacteria bacterium]|jgi:FAD/FMN-containing dehydrogenase/Fe-S oxidoreductase|nr:FAD-binding oxidoreductase [Deltaproteobacteria bacterium]